MVDNGMEFFVTLYIDVKHVDPTFTDECSTAQ